MMSKVMGMLRDVREEDLPVFYEHQRSLEACRLAGFSPRGWDAFIGHWRTKILSDATVLKRTIVVGSDTAGNILSWSEGSSRLVGYWIGLEYWGRGIATAALSDFLRVELVRPLLAYVAAHNLSSMRVLEKCDFRRVGDTQTGADGIEECVFERRSV